MPIARPSKPLRGRQHGEKSPHRPGSGIIDFSAVPTGDSGSGSIMHQLLGCPNPLDYNHAGASFGVRCKTINGSSSARPFMIQTSAEAGSVILRCFQAYPTSPVGARCRSTRCPPLGARMSDVRARLTQKRPRCLFDRPVSPIQNAPTPGLTTHVRLVARLLPRFLMLWSGIDRVAQTGAIKAVNDH